jgi:CspA family cold shock protein
MEGKVKWFSAARGYGFIREPDGQDLFVHYSAIDTLGFRCLDPGQSVNFEVISNKDRREAAHVVKI